MEKKRWLKGEIPQPNVIWILVAQYLMTANGRRTALYKGHLVLRHTVSNIMFCSVWRGVADCWRRGKWWQTSCPNARPSPPPFRTSWTKSASKRSGEDFWFTEWLASASDGQMGIVLLYVMWSKNFLFVICHFRKSKQSSSSSHKRTLPVTILISLSRPWYPPGEPLSELHGVNLIIPLPLRIVD